MLQFVYLTASEPDAFTSDNFRDVRTLQLEPRFAAAMEQAFNPLGVYLNFWEKSLPVRESRHYTIELVNDEDRARSGILKLQFVVDGSVAAESELPFNLGRLGADSYSLALGAPAAAGIYTLRAVVRERGNEDHLVMSSRRVALTVSSESTTVTRSR